LIGGLGNRAASVPCVQAVAASGIEALIARHGGDPAGLMRRAGIDPQELAAPDGRVGLDRYCTLFETAARELEVDGFGLRFGHECYRSLLGILGDLAFNSPTVGAALAAMCRFFPTIQDQSCLTLRLQGRVVCLSYQIRDGRIVARRQDAELTIGSLLNVIRVATGPDWAPTEVLFEHAPPADRRDHEALLGAPVFFSSGINALRFPVEVLAAAMPAADGAALPAIETRALHRVKLAQPDDFVGRVFQEVRAGLPAADFGQPAVAARLGMAEATLYRRLREHRLQYSDIVRDLRHNLAISLLQQRNLSLTEIALLLGYSELSAFTRAFSHWTGVPPSEYRRAA
jgi:AraC-like DNA-binding protein